MSKQAHRMAGQNRIGGLQGTAYVVALLFIHGCQPLFDGQGSNLVQPSENVLQLQSQVALLQEAPQIHHLHTCTLPPLTSLFLLIAAAVVVAVVAVVVVVVVIDALLSSVVPAFNFPPALTIHLERLPALR